MQIAHELDCLRRVLDAWTRGDEPSVNDVSVSVLSGVATQEMLWVVVEGLQRELTALSAELRAEKAARAADVAALSAALAALSEELRAEKAARAADVAALSEELRAEKAARAADEAALSAEVTSLKGDRQKLVLRQMGTQALNKLARYCISSLKTPHDARYASLDIIQRHKQRSQPRVQGMLSKYPDLGVGISALNDQAFGLAHPDLVEDGQGKLVPPNSRLLRSLVKEHFGGSLVEQEVQQVLDCLEEMGQELGEDLFVDASKP